MGNTPDDDKLTSLQSLLNQSDDEIVSAAVAHYHDYMTGTLFCLPTDQARAVMIKGSIGFAEKILQGLGIDVQLEAVGQTVNVTSAGKSFSLQIPPPTTKGEVH